MEEYKEAFALFDKKKQQRINPKEFQEMLRYLGFIYQDGEVMDMIKEAGGFACIKLKLKLRKRFHYPKSIFNSHGKEIFNRINTGRFNESICCF